MRKVRTRNSVAPSPAGQPVAADGWNAKASELALAADRLLREYGQSKSGRTYALRLIGIYTVISELGATAFTRYGYSNDHAAYFIRRLQKTGTVPRGCGRP